MKAPNVLATIGNTPHIRINRLFGSAEVWIKSERANPGGSIKDRIGLAMVEDAEKSGKLKPGGTIVEPTSGNTGIGLAIVAAVKGYPCILVMPDSMTVERRRLILAYGAKIVLTPRAEGMKGSIAKAKEILAATPGSWMPQQFENPANVDVHVRTTAQEILADFPDGFDALITGVGTGGHITGCARVLKKKWPKLKVFAVEPTASSVICRRHALAPPDPGHRRGLHPGDPRSAAARRNDLGRCRGREGDGSPLRPGGRDPRRRFLGRDAAGHRAEAARAAQGREGAGLQLRHRRALSVDGRVPAGRRGVIRSP